MPSNSLTLLSQHLADQVAKATDSQKRLACLALCKLAISRTGLADSRVEDALRSLEDKSYEDKRLMAALRQLIDELDDKYFAARELEEAGKGKKETYLSLFRKARAASAVLFALGGNPSLAARESIFEACTALDDIDEALVVLSEVSTREH